MNNELGVVSHNVRRAIVLNDDNKGRRLHGGSNKGESYRYTFVIQVIRNKFQNATCIPARIGIFAICHPSNATVGSCNKNQSSIY